MPRAADPDNEQASLGLRWVRLRSKVSLADIVDATVPVPTMVEQAATYEEAAPESPEFEQTVATVSCPNCGTANAADEKFCADCGHDLTVADDQPAVVMSAPEQSKQKSSARAMIFATVAIIAVTIAVVGFIILQAH